MRRLITICAFICGSMLLFSGAILAAPTAPELHPIFGKVMEYAWPFIAFLALAAIAGGFLLRRGIATDLTRYSIGLLVLLLVFAALLMFAAGQLISWVRSMLL